MYKEQAKTEPLTRNAVDAQKARGHTAKNKKAPTAWNLFLSNHCAKAREKGSGDGVSQAGAVAACLTWVDMWVHDCYVLRGCVFKWVFVCLDAWVGRWVGEQVSAWVGGCVAGGCRCWE